MTSTIDTLKDSSDFLNILLDNMNSAVLIADENLKITKVNKAFLGMFDGAPSSAIGKTCGQTMGCIHTHREGQECGNTSQCKECLVHNSLVRAAREGIPADRIRFQEVFHIRGKSELKIFEFTARPIVYQGRKMTLMLFYDITEIEQQRAELEQKQRQINIDLEAAAGIQKSLLPNQLPAIPNFEISWFFEPCASIGGDIFNVFFIDPNHLAVYMIDVCGHGVSAALVSVAVSQFLQNRNPFIGGRIGIMPPDQVLNRLNRTFPFERFDTFFSIVYAVVNLPEATVDYSNAGHPPLIRQHANGRLQTLETHGPVIGGDLATVYTKSTIHLESGDNLFFYTDGILENQTTSGVLYGKDRFHEAVGKFRSEAVQDIVHHVCKAVKTFNADGVLEDDVSMLGIAYRPD